MNIILYLNRVWVHGAGDVAATVSQNAFLLAYLIYSVAPSLKIWKLPFSLSLNAFTERLRVPIVSTREQLIALKLYRLPACWDWRRGGDLKCISLSINMSSVRFAKPVTTCDVINTVPAKPQTLHPISPTLHNYTFSCGSSCLLKVVCLQYCVSSPKHLEREERSLGLQSATWPLDVNRPYTLVL